MKFRVLAMIPARGGSQSIPRKNVKLLLGQPLITYTIDAAKRSHVFERILVSTDDVEIAEVSKKNGCEPPFLRPKEIAAGDTPMLPVVQHAVEWLKEKEDYLPEAVMVLQPTSPLRQPFHIKEAVDLMVKLNVDSVVGVGKIPELFSPGKAMCLNNDGFLELFDGREVKNRPKRRQDLYDTYYSNAAIYLLRTHLLFENEPNLFGSRVAHYVMEEKYNIDVNEPDDWLLAENALKRIQEEAV